MHEGEIARWDGWGLDMPTLWKTGLLGDEGTVLSLWQVKV